MSYPTSKVLPNLTEATTLSDADLFYVVGSDYKSTLQTTRHLMNPCSSTTPKFVDYEIPASECDGRWFSNKGSIVTRTFTLPSIASDLVVGFLVDAVHYLIITPQTGDQIVQLTSSPGQSIRSITIGSSIVLKATGNNWYVIKINGTWEAI